MRYIILWALGVPVVALIALHLLGILWAGRLSRYSPRPARLERRCMPMRVGAMSGTASLTRHALP